VFEAWGKNESVIKVKAKSGKNLCCFKNKFFDPKGCLNFKNQWGNKISKIFRNRLFGVYENILYFSDVFITEYLQ
jgi:hypothetical protein